MGKKGITLELRARNLLARGLKSAGAAMQSIGRAAAKVGKRIAMGFLAAGAAAAGFAVKALRAWSVQEKAEKSAEAALRAYGDELENNVANIKRFAAAIQDETGVADENLIARAAKLRMLGVEADALEAATKATVALKSAGMGEEQAIRAVALARQGEFTTLQRYIPALRSATSEAEKAQIVNDFLTRGYAQQKEELNTVAGMWGLLKGRVGDAWEEVGKAIAQNGMLVEALDKAQEWVKKLSDRIREWAESGGLQNAIRRTQEFVAYFQHGMDVVRTSANMAFAAFGDVAETVVRYVSHVFQTMVRTNVEGIGAQVKAFRVLWEAIRRPSKAAFQAAKEAFEDYVKTGIEANKRLGKAIAGESGLVTKRTEAALKDREGLQERHDARMAAIAARHAKKSVEGESEAAEESGAAQETIAIAAENTAKRREELAKRQKDLQKELADAEKKAAAERVQAARDELAEKERIASQSVRAFIDGVRQQRRAERQWERDQERARRLRRRAHLTPAQREFIAAVETVGQARAAMPGMQAKLTEAERQLVSMEKQERTMTEVRDELRAVHKDLTKLLAAG
jgi:hypothetical protein